MADTLRERNGNGLKQRASPLPLTMLDSGSDRTAAQRAQALSNFGYSLDVPMAAF